MTAISCGRSATDATVVQGFLKQHKTQRLVRLNQQHTANCLVLGKQQPNDTESDEPADAVLSDRSDLILSLYTADCLPILLYHPSGIIGAIHAGRRGTEAGVLKQTLLLLQTHWGVERDVQLWFGPAICRRCYQVDRVTDLRYDLRVENKKQAESIFPNKTVQITDSEHCTFHQNTEWYSYRKEGKGMAMNYSYIALF